MARQLSEIYSKMITEDFLKRQLKQGTIPLPIAIENEVSSYREKTDNFIKPIFQSEEHLIEEKEVSSASKFNSAIELIIKDLMALYQGLVDQGARIQRIYESTFSIFESQETTLDRYAEELNRILFASEELDAYEDLFYEQFINKDNVDRNLTTLFVNTQEKQVELQPIETSILSFNFKQNDIDISVKPSEFLQENISVSGMSPLNAFNQKNLIWQQQVKMSVDVPSVQLILELRIPDSSKIINQILIDPAEASNKTTTYCDLYHSTDRLNWNKVEGEWSKRLLSKTSFTFRGIKTKYMRFVFRKKGVDSRIDNNFYYMFGAKEIIFIGKSYRIKDRILEGILFSQPIVPQTLDYLSYAGFSFCHETPGLTNNTYSVFLLTENNLNNYNSNILSTLPEYFLDVESDKVTTLDLKSLQQDPINFSNIGLDPSINYESRSNDTCALSLDASIFDKNHTVIFRGQGDNQTSLITGQESYISKIPLGWTVEGEYYSTIIDIVDYQGFSFDLGHSEAFIDDKRVTGQVLLPPGQYRFKTHRQNWMSLDISDLNENRLIDPLYPYNHKMIIEGLRTTLYNVDLDQDRGGWTVREKLDPENIYTSDLKYWAYKLTEQQAFNFFSDRIPLDTFTYTLDNNGIERIIVNTSNENDRILLERFYVMTKSTGNEPIKGLVVKVKMSTEDTSVSPLLKEYLVRMK